MTRTLEDALWALGMAFGAVGGLAVVGLLLWAIKALGGAITRKGWE